MAVAPNEFIGSNIQNERMVFCSCTWYKVANSLTLLFESSEENGSVRGIGLIPGVVGRFDSMILQADMYTLFILIVLYRYKNFERLHRRLKGIPNYTLHLPPKRIFSSTNVASNMKYFFSISSKSEVISRLNSRTKM
ncbi:unnamed protein product [Lactuca virosa]|uniref:Uncharacterized protein n=1 Tax=Lactuca virosa TaxID=75947 RepID=A0AAU9NRR7_9ASTR|nr:unnamed protein product [Lactuca virosa]